MGPKRPTRRRDAVNRGGRESGLAATSRGHHSADGGAEGPGKGGRFAAAALAVLASPTLAETAAAKRWPSLFETINATKDVNGEPCEPGGVSFNVKGGRLSWSLRSPAYNVRLSGWSDTLEGLLDAIEAALNAEKPAVVELKKHVGNKFRGKAKSS